MTHQNPQPEYFTARMTYDKDPNPGQILDTGNLEIFPQLAFNQEIRVYGVEIAAFSENSNFQNQATYADLLGVIQGSLGLNLFVGSNQIPFQSINVSDLITSKNQVIYFPSPIVIEMKQPLRIGGSILPNSLGKGLKEQLMLKVTLICERHLKEN